MIDASGNSPTQTRPDRAVGWLLRTLARSASTDSWKNHEYELLAQAIAEEHIGKMGPVLDIGCGEGILTEHIARLMIGRTVSGMDLCPSSDWLRSRKRAKYLVGNACQPPLKPRAVPVVLAKDLLHHAEDPALALRWLTMIASHRIVVIEANLENPIMALYTRYNGDQHMTVERLNALLQGVAPHVDWRLSHATAYPFYPPPVRDRHALWVWPTAGLMLVAFRLLRLGIPARWLHSYLRSRSWSPPYIVAVGDLVEVESSDRAPLNE